MISVNYRDSRPIYEQVRDNFCQLIITGIMLPTSKLPTVKELAAELSINPNAIQRAYMELENEGYVFSIPGRGCFVSGGIDVNEEKKAELIDKFLSAASELRGLGVSQEKLIELLKGDSEK